MTDAVLSLNVGSSSIKFQLSEVQGGAPVAIATGQVEAIGRAPHLIVRDGDGTVLAERRWEAGAELTHETFLDDLLGWIENYIGRDRLIGVGHRVVHGGEHFSVPVVVTADVLDRLERLIPFAPLHQPHNLAAIRAMMALRPGLAQIACFDTGFHAALPPVATRFAIPRAIVAEGVRRYGFHGLSYEYIARRLAELDPKLAGGRVIAAHLGNGASLCALQNGRSIDTTMGFTALDGLVMGTRCGAIDPGVLLYLAQQRGMTADAIEALLYTRSGLLGVSGLSSDMRDLLASHEPAAAEAVEVFAYSVARHAGALASVLCGLDGIVFTAGIGEKAASVRADICDRLAWLGIELDEEANAHNAAVISTQASRVRVRVIPTDEERMIAIHLLELLGGMAALGRRREHAM